MRGTQIKTLPSEVFQLTKTDLVGQKGPFFQDLTGVSIKRVWLNEFLSTTTSSLLLPPLVTLPPQTYKHGCADEDTE